MKLFLLSTFWILWPSVVWAEHQTNARPRPLAHASVSFPPGPVDISNDFGPGVSSNGQATPIDKSELGGGRCRVIFLTADHVIERIFLSQFADRSFGFSNPRGGNVIKIPPTNYKIYRRPGESTQRLSKSSEVQSKDTAVVSVETECEKVNFISPVLMGDVGIDGKAIITKEVWMQKRGQTLSGGSETNPGGGVLMKGTFHSVDSDGRARFEIPKISGKLMQVGDSGGPVYKEVVFDGKPALVLVGAYSGSGPAGEGRLATVFDIGGLAWAKEILQKINSENAVASRGPTNPSREASPVDKDPGLLPAPVPAPSFFPTHSPDKDQQLVNGQWSGVRQPTPELRRSSDLRSGVRAASGFQLPWFMGPTRHVRELFSTAARRENPQIPEPEPGVVPGAGRGTTNPTVTTAPSPESSSPVAQNPVNKFQRNPLEEKNVQAVESQMDHYAGKCIKCHAKTSPVFENLEQAKNALRNLTPEQLDHMLGVRGDTLGGHLNAEEKAHLESYTRRNRSVARLAPPAPPRARLVSDREHDLYQSLLPKGCSGDSGGDLLENLKVRGMIFYNDRVSPKVFQSQMTSGGGTGLSPNSTAVTAISVKERNRVPYMRVSGFRDGSLYYDHGNSEFPWDNGAGILRKESSEQSFKIMIPPPTGPMVRFTRVDSNNFAYQSPLKNERVPAYGAQYQVGTILAEVITTTDPLSNQSIPSTIRLMEMTPEGWRYDVLSLFDDSQDMLAQVKSLAQEEPWRSNPEVANFIRQASDSNSAQLENFMGKLTPLERVQNNLTSQVMQNNALVQKLPRLPPAFVKAVSSRGCFRSVMGKPWIQKSINGKMEVGWDPGGDSGFFPKGYQGAHVAKTTQSCVGCHSSAMKHVTQFNPPTGALSGSGGANASDGGVRDWYGHVRGSIGQKVAGFSRARAGAFSPPLFDVNNLSAVPNTSASRPIKPRPELIGNGLIEWTP